MNLPNTMPNKKIVKKMIRFYSPKKNRLWITSNKINVTVCTINSTNINLKNSVEFFQLEIDLHSFSNKR